MMNLVRIVCGNKITHNGKRLYAVAEFKHKSKIEKQNLI